MLLYNTIYVDFVYVDFVYVDFVYVDFVRIMSRQLSKSASTFYNTMQKFGDLRANLVVAIIRGLLVLSDRELLLVGEETAAS
jgi:hypothetical protein